MNNDYEYIDRPCQYAIYKGMKGTNGAFQFNLIPFDPARAIDRARTDRKEQEKEKKGFILISAAPATGKNVYDWKGQGIKFSLSETDIGKILVGTKQIKDEGETLVDIFHKHDDSGTMKKLVIKQGGVYGGSSTWMFTLAAKGDSGSSTVTIPVSCDELLVLRTLLEASLPALMGWAPRLYLPELD